MTMTTDTQTVWLDNPSTIVGPGLPKPRSGAR